MSFLRLTTARCTQPARRGFVNYQSSFARAIRSPFAGSSAYEGYLSTTDALGQKPITRHFHASNLTLKKQGGKEKKQNDKGSKEFSHTLQLPNTPFGIRANAAQRDRLFCDRTCGELYQWQRSRPDTSGDFVFHDGPPYANGNLHCGHALNKILKDITNRYQVLRGKRVHYMPGWDCHGLPIEAKALANVEPDERHKLAAHDIRMRARYEAMKAIETQKGEFSQFGIMADWSDGATYRTLDPAYEARQLRVFGEMVRKGLIYRQYRPVYWSPSNRTALAESELEYREDHLSKAVYVAFKLAAGPGLLQKLGKHSHVAESLNAIIWTTTPWSLPSNMAITRIRPSWYLPGAAMLWSIVSASTASATSFGGLVTIRFFLGIVEAPLFPGAVYVMSCWYTRKELALRYAVLYTGLVLAMAVSGLIAAGVFAGLHGTMGLAGWQWLFILEGAIGFALAVAAL